MSRECGSHTYVYRPGFRFSVTFFVPVHETLVITLLTGPRRWKLCSDERSLTTSA
jgi:hypothetical protein